MRPIYYSVLFAASCSTLLLTACEQAVESSEPVLRPVRSIIIEPSGGGGDRIFSGTARSSQETELSFKVSGSIQRRPVKVGDSLKFRDLVAELDASSYQLQAQQAEASLLQADANERNAKANYDRVRGLYENNNASRNDLDSARANAESAHAQFVASHKSLQLARLNVEYTRLTSPGDCSVAAVNADVDENVTIGSPIVNLNCGNELEVEVGVPESLITSIKAGMPAPIRFSAHTDRTYRGQVTEVGVSASGNTFPVTVAVEGDNPELRSGLAAEVSFSIPRSDTKDVYLVPLASVINDQSGTYVYTIKPGATSSQGVVEKRAVQLGDLTALGMEVESGLAEGDRVVTAGVSVIRAGQQVLLP